MYTMFRYNWKVRDDWFAWCQHVSLDELLRPRTGGVGGILATLFHIVDVECSWIRLMQGHEELIEPFDSYRSLGCVQSLSRQCRPEVERFVRDWTLEMENDNLSLPQVNGATQTLAFGEIMRHVIAHEIHHIGQLSVWARDVGRPPVSANLLGRGLFSSLHPS